MKELIQDLRKFLTPEQPSSWQTLLLLSLFSVLIAFFTSTPTQNFLASCGWVFLILATWWFIYEAPVKKALTFPGVFTEIFLGPWVVGAMICLFLFGSWGGLGQLTALTPVAFICWAPVSAAIAIAPNFIKTDPATKTPKFTWPKVDLRQGLVLFVLSHLLIACWFQFYFLLQGWLSVYPSLLAESFDHSAFVIKVQRDEKGTTKGKDLLNAAELELRDRLKQQSWGDIERWLFENNRQQWVKDLETKVEQQLQKRKPFGENNWWKLRGKVTTDTFDTGAMYNLQLDAVWQGPTSLPSGYYLSKRCELTPKREFFRKRGDLLPETRVVGQVKCKDVTQPIELKPESKATGA